MIVTVSIFTALAMFFVTHTLTKHQRPKSAALGIYAAMSALVAGGMALVYHADQERRLRTFVRMKAKQDAIRRQQEDLVLDDLRSHVANGINARMLRSKGSESSERIAMLTYVSGGATGTYGRSASKTLTPP
jgi:hypothetical protein